MKEVSFEVLSLNHAALLDSQGPVNGTMPNTSTSLPGLGGPTCLVLLGHSSLPHTHTAFVPTSSSLDRQGLLQNTFSFLFQPYPSFQVQLPSFPRECDSFCISHSCLGLAGSKSKLGMVGIVCPPFLFLNLYLH